MHITFGAGGRSSEGHCRCWIYEEGKTICLLAKASFSLPCHGVMCLSLVHNLYAVFFFLCQVSEAIHIGAQAIKENRISVEEVHIHLQELDENIAAQKQVNEALGNMLIILCKTFFLILDYIIRIFLSEMNLSLSVIHFFTMFKLQN